MKMAKFVIFGKLIKIEFGLKSLKFSFWLSVCISLSVASSCVQEIMEDKKVAADQALQVTELLPFFLIKIKSFLILDCCHCK